MENTATANPDGSSDTAERSAVYTERVTSRRVHGASRQIAIRTFAGTSSEDYDLFLDTRFDQEGAPRWRVGTWVEIDGRERHAQYEFRIDGGDLP